MKMSEKGTKLLAQWEGFETEVYLDVAGLKTIGVGHLLTKDELSSGKIFIGGETVRYGDGLSEQQVYGLLGQDLAKFEQAVEDEVTVPLSANQFDALVSFAFNVGAAAFSGSTLLRLLNQGKYDEVPTQLRRWVRSGGNIVQGLVNRRENEIGLWNGSL